MTIGTYNSSCCFSWVFVKPDPREVGRIRGEQHTAFGWLFLLIQQSQSCTCTRFVRELDPEDQKLPILYRMSNSFHNLAAQKQDTHLKWMSELLRISLSIQKSIGFGLSGSRLAFLGSGFMSRLTCKECVITLNICKECVYMHFDHVCMYTCGSGAVKALKLFCDILLESCVITRDNIELL